MSAVLATVGLSRPISPVDFSAIRLCDLCVALIGDITGMAVVNGWFIPIGIDHGNTV